MKKYLIRVIFNQRFWNMDSIAVTEEKSFSREFAKNLSDSLMRTAYPNSSTNEYNLCEILSIDKNQSEFADYYNIEEMKKKYINQKGYKQILIFQSIYDVHSNLKKAAKYLLNLQEIGFVIYIYSLNPKEDFSKYCIQFLNYNNISEITEKRFRHGKRDDSFMKFAANLRLGDDPVTYATISKYTGIPKGTLKSYMDRNNLRPSSERGRNWLTEYEKKLLKNYLMSGYSM